MIEPVPPLLRVDVAPEHTLDDYTAVAHLAAAAGELKTEAASIVPRLAGRTIWHVSSTATGGGVAELLPPVIRLLRDLGISTEWVVIGSSDPAFFALTKRLHNLIHGSGDPRLGPEDREVFQRAGRENADRLQPLLRPGDVLIVHDPQPLPLAGFLRPAVPLVTIWRCHIGLDESNAATRAAWDFLTPYLTHYDHAVFSAPEYIPRAMAGRARVIFPGIDPLASKNRELTLHETVGILCRGALIPCPGPTVGDPYPGTRPPGSAGREVRARERRRERRPALPADHHPDLAVGPAEGVSPPHARHSRRSSSPSTLPTMAWTRCCDAGSTSCVWCWPAPTPPVSPTIRRPPMCWTSSGRPMPGSTPRCRTTSPSSCCPCGPSRRTRSWSTPCSAPRPSSCRIRCARASG